MSKIVYDTYYYENMLEMYAGSGHDINQVRWEFMKDLPLKHVLDYGCGCNMFSLFRPNGVNVDSYDIGHIGSAVYPQTGIRRERYDAIAFFDVLEHVDWGREPDNDILRWMQYTDFVVTSVPMLPDGADLDVWKHNKPGEHLTLFNVDSLCTFMEAQGFELMQHGTPECPPRRDIQSFIFRKVNEREG